MDEVRNATDSTWNAMDDAWNTKGGTMDAYNPAPHVAANRKESTSISSNK